MILKSLKLQNIRSYTSQHIEFPTGTILLSGDIGSGKSTILLAIEFALFGIRRNYLTGTTLLRHGKNEGFIEMEFEIEGMDICIKRVLRRVKDEVTQHDGYIIKNGIKKNCSPLELRSEIFSILGYPRELLTRSKDIVYRYTVYTPQEEMKQILSEEQEVRLDILRKIFNIDKYKRIKENAENILLRELREKKRNCEIRISDLELKKQEKSAMEKHLKEIESEISMIAEIIKSMEREIATARKLKDEMEQKIKEVVRIKNMILLSETRIRGKRELINNNESTVMRLKKQIAESEGFIDRELLENSEGIAENIRVKEREIEKAEQSIIEIASGISSLSTKKNDSLEILRRISILDTCPLCLQNVTPEYKEGITEKELKKAEQLSGHIGRLLQNQNESRTLMQMLKQELKNMKMSIEKITIMRQRIESIEEKKREIAKQEEITLSLSRETNEISIQKQSYAEELAKFSDTEVEYRNIQSGLEILIAKERESAIKQARAENEKQNIIKSISQLEGDIIEKESLREKMLMINSMHNWINEFFLSLMDTIERHIMLNIYYEFDKLFQGWFNELIDDDTISVRIDYGFTPLIEQNGYDTMIDNLSGGEKTSVALAYRLALNKVINDISGEIKTKDILMLDEPTDGFSSEQLDKIRIVLEQLNIKQIIIVSHESKIESFVDNVIRINKNEHVSEIA